MDARLIDRVETIVERAASASFAGAIAFAAYTTAADWAPQFPPAAGAAGAAAFAYLVCARILAIIAAEEDSHSIPAFSVGEIEISGPDVLQLTDTERRMPDELVLTDDDRLAPNELVLTDSDRFRATAEEPLLLEDRLDELAVDSRVVRLFDRRSMPSAIETGRPPYHPASAPPLSDASRALSDALAELRRSLR